MNKKFNTRGAREWSDKSYNIQIGCKYNCIPHCYACNMWVNRRKEKTYDNWKEAILLQKNIDKGWRKLKEFDNRSRKRIMFPTMHDIYQENVDDYIKVALKILRAGHSLLITTKPDLLITIKLCKKLAAFKNRPVLRLLDEEDGVENWTLDQQLQFRNTITSDNVNTAKQWELDAPAPDVRFASLIHQYDEGFATSLSMEPFFDSVPDMLRHIKKMQPYVTESIWIGPMNRRHLRDKRTWKENLWGRQALIERKLAIESDIHINQDLIRYKDAYWNAIK
jgi:DNA repair photolyase